MAKLEAFVSGFARQPRGGGAGRGDDGGGDGWGLGGDGMDLDDGAPQQRFKYMRALVRPPPLPLGPLLAVFALILWKRRGGTDVFLRHWDRPGGGLAKHRPQAADGAHH